MNKPFEDSRYLPPCARRGNKKKKDDVQKACQLNSQLALIILVVHSCHYDMILE
jgi:hypothetical protein